MHAPSTGLNLADPAVYTLARRIYFARFSGRVKAAGIDEDDGFQEVLLGLLRRQAGKSRYNPAKSGLSNYLFIAMTGLTINLADSARRRSWCTLGAEADIAEAQLEADGGSVTSRTVQDLATEMEIPMGVAQALADGTDVVLAGMDAGMPPQQAALLAAALGLR